MTFHFFHISSSPLQHQSTRRNQRSKSLQPPQDRPSTTHSHSPNCRQRSRQQRQLEEGAVLLKRRKNVKHADGYRAKRRGLDGGCCSCREVELLEIVGGVEEPADAGDERNGTEEVDGGSCNGWHRGTVNGCVNAV
jgi:hypothetical protein